eukprot:TRINITY_DN79687_c0_g1_i1.p1 TRINITY_DN79687_c0_g1~~TRINITY_DN79687_c0_g1_i1.p1  ORF type:complete len:186 (-),score=24.19 TRINITY_DN79687_c0_g1_i1:73-630(-)
MCDVEPIQRRRVQPVPKEVINLKMMVLGDAGIGKTSLVKALCSPEESLSSRYEPTVGADFVVHNLLHAGREFRVNIWDVGGDPKFVDVRNEFYKDMQGILLLFDVTSRRSFQNLDRWMDEVAKFNQGADVQYVLVGTKAESSPRSVTEQVAREWARGRNLPYFEVSAAQKTGLEMPFKELASRLS